MRKPRLLHTLACSIDNRLASLCRPGRARSRPYGCAPHLTISGRFALVWNRRCTARSLLIRSGDALKRGWRFEMLQAWITGALLLGEIAVAQPNIDSVEVYYATKDYSSVVRLLENQPSVRKREQILLGWSHYRLGNMLEAKRAFQEGLEIAPRQSRLAQRVGVRSLPSGRVRRSRGRLSQSSGTCTAAN